MREKKRKTYKRKKQKNKKSKENAWQEKTVLYNNFVGDTKSPFKLIIAGGCIMELVRVENMDLYDLNLSFRAVAVLHHKGIEKVGQLLRVSIEELRNFKNMNAKTFKEILLAIAGLEDIKQKTK